MVHAVFVRSPYAHARIDSLDVQAALRVPGVAAVFTFESLARWMRPLPLFGSIPPRLQERVAITSKQSAQFPLASEIVRFAGEAVAMVVAASRHAAENGAEE